MEEINNKPNKPKSEFLQNFSKGNDRQSPRKKVDLLEGYAIVNSFEVQLTQYTKMVCSLHESKTRPGLFRTEQRINYSRIVYDGNLLFVVAETLKELGDSFVPPELRPKKPEGSN